MLVDTSAWPFKQSLTLYLLNSISCVLRKSELQSY